MTMPDRMADSFDRVFGGGPSRRRWELNTQLRHAFAQSRCGIAGAVPFLPLVASRFPSDTFVRSRERIVKPVLERSDPLFRDLAQLTQPFADLLTDLGQLRPHSRYCSWRSFARCWPSPLWVLIRRACTRGISHAPDNDIMPWLAG
ncbi:MAG: hypothetical protein JWO15_1817 [Sphingomonadales bacterium]|nr:hypothetical protein [Sphingomonadales bacterium]